MGTVAYPLASEPVASTIASAMYKTSVQASVLGFAVNMFEGLLAKRERAWFLRAARYEADDSHD